MKRFTLIILLLSMQLIQAQIHVSLNVSSHPTPQISEWENRNETAILTITNTNPNMEGENYKILAYLYLDDRLIAETRYQDMPILQLPLGTDTFMADQIIPFQALDIHEQQGERTTIIRTGMLPAGNYRFCVQLMDMENNVISLPERVCNNMIITDYQMPELILPTNLQEISATNAPNIIFRWTPISPMPPAQDGVKYIVSVSEIQNGQTPQQAFISNHPIIEEEVIGANYLYMASTNINLTGTAVFGNNQTNYVWSVKAVRMNDTPYATTNSGFAPIFTYSIKAPLSASGTNNTPDTNNQQTSPTMQNVNTRFFAGAGGEFVVKVTQWNDVKGKHTGIGSVYIDWLKSAVSVHFKDIELDSVNKLKRGTVYAKIDAAVPSYPKQWVKTNRKSWKNNDIVTFMKWAQSNPQRFYAYEGTTENPPSKLPVGILIDHEKLMITEMSFSSTGSSVNLVTSKSLPPSWGIHELGFYGWRIEFHPDKFSDKFFYLRLNEDINIEQGAKDKIAYNFKASKGKKIDGCYMRFVKDSVSYKGVIDAKMPLTWLQLVDKKTKTNTVVSLSGIYKNWNDIILTGKLPKSLIPDTDGIKIQADNISFDLSDISNPTSMNFPSGYPNTSKHFMGFYTKKIQVEMPDAWKQKDHKPIHFEAQDLIIDKNGISTLMRGVDIINIKKGKVADMTGSIDEASIKIQLNKLTDAWVKGRLVLPISDKKKKDNYLKYKALFHIAKDTNDVTGIQLTIQPGLINTEMLEGKMDLDKTSNISAYVGSKKTSFKIDLSGKFYWEKATDQKEKKKNIFEINFQHVGLNYDNTNKKKPFMFKQGTWAFASPQKKVSGFPVSIKKIYYRQQMITGQQVLNGELRFDCVFNISKDIGGTSTFGLKGSIEKNNDDFQPKFDGFGISKITVNAKTPTVDIKGSLDFFSKDYVFGDGFKSKIDVNFKVLKFTTKALVQFGNTNYLNSNGIDYRYWRVEALATFPSPGIPFLPGVAFRGFGGGAYYNMHPEDKKINNKKTIVFKPKKGDWGLKATAVLATTPKGDVLNADITVKADITQHDGLKKVGFLGEFYVGADINKRDKAHAKGKLNVDYDIPQEHFNMAANLSLDLKIIKASNINFGLDINGKKGDWSIKLGEPKNMNTVTLFPKELKLNISEYLMVGNKIPSPTGFSSKYIAAYKNVIGVEPGFKSTLTTTNKKAALGQGFSFGVNFMFSTKDTITFKKINIFGYYPGIGYDLSAGAELYGSLMEYKGSCAGFNPIGMNGWRAQAGLSVFGNISLQGAIYQSKDNKEIFKYTVASAKVGAWVQGEFPRPSFVAGRFQGKVKVLFFDFDFDESFKYGTACRTLQSDKGTIIKANNVLTKLSKNKLIEQVYPSDKTNGLSVHSPVTVKYGFVPNEVFTLPEQQKDGTIKNRTFCLHVTTEMKKEKFGFLRSVALISTKNNLGEIEYTPKNNPNTSYSGSNNIVDNTGNFGNGFQNGALYPPKINSTTPTVSGGAMYGNGNPVNQSGNHYGGFQNGPAPMEEILNEPYQLIPFPSFYNQEPSHAQTRWESNNNYLFTVTAELQELKANKWVKTKANMYEKQVVKFTTEFIQGESNASNSGQLSH